MRTRPSNLLNAAGRLLRARHAPEPRIRELALHTATVDLLRKRVGPEWQWAHHRSGNACNARTGAKLKRMGTKRGWPALILISARGVFHGLELKAEGGTLTDEQQEFQVWAIRHGVAYAVAWSLDEVLIILRAWGVIATSGGVG